MDASRFYSCSAAAESFVQKFFFCLIASRPMMLVFIFYIFLFIFLCFMCFLCFLCFGVYYVCGWAKLPEIKLDDDDDAYAFCANKHTLRGAHAQNENNW